MKDKLSLNATNISGYHYQILNVNDYHRHEFRMRYVSQQTRKSNVRFNLVLICVKMAANHISNHYLFTCMTMSWQKFLLIAHYELPMEKKVP